MFESLRDGILGFFLFTGQLLLPASEQASLSVTSIRPADSLHWNISVVMDPALNPQIEELVNAGIPMRFRICAVTEGSDTARFERTLRFSVAHLTYTYVDSLNGYIQHSKTYPMILLAMNDFCKWSFTVPREAAWCRIEATLLPSRVSQLRRMVDMSKVWGQSRVSVVVRPSVYLAGKK